MIFGSLNLNLHRATWSNLESELLRSSWMHADDRPKVKLKPPASDNSNERIQHISTIRPSDSLLEKTRAVPPTTSASPRSPRDYQTLTESMQRYRDPLYPNLTYPRNLRIWEGSSQLPDWAKTYFAWHERERARLNESDWEQHRYLVLWCGLKMKCGGTADRLRSVPFLVRLAAATKRLFFVRWERPLPLEDLLLPPIGGLDWRLPFFLTNKLGTSRFAKKMISRSNSSEVLIKTKLQHFLHGSDWYTQEAIRNGEPWDAYELQYHDIWYTLFTPVPDLARRIEKELVQHGLVPGHYGSIHLRALYDSIARSQNISLLTQNALRCMSTLRGGPYYFASDSAEARTLVRGLGRERNLTVVTRVDTMPLHHIDVANSTKSSDYFEIFVDLYLLSFGRCLTNSYGGFGTWAQLISGRDFACRRTFGLRQGFALCSGEAFVDGVDENVVETLQLPLFLSPMNA